MWATLGAVARSFGHAARGLGVLMGQRNARVHAVAAVLVVALGVWLGISPNSLQRLEPHLCVLPGETKINVNTASETVLMASLVFSFQRYFEYQIEAARLPGNPVGPAPLAHQGGGGEVSAAEILGQSARTIQRRLADDGIDYETLVDDCRRAKARVLLARPRASVTAEAGNWDRYGTGLDVQGLYSYGSGSIVAARATGSLQALVQRTKARPQARSSWNLEGFGELPAQYARAMPLRKGLDETPPRIVIGHVAGEAPDAVRWGCRSYDD